MKTVKNYDKFSEEYRLNENLIGKAWDAIKNFFVKKFKKDSWFHMGLYLIKNGELPKSKVEFVLPNSYSTDSVLTKKDVEELATESLKNSDIYITPINEAVINLEHPDPNVRNVDVPDLVEKIIRIYNMNKHRVEIGEKRTKNNAVFIWGAPGIGKTEILNQVANSLNIVVQEWHLSQIEPTDFRGIPKAINVSNSGNWKDERTVSILPQLFPASDNPDPDKLGLGGIMFFDELNRAPKMVLSAALSLCLSGKVGDYELPPHWIVIAAGNRPSDLGSAPVTDIEPALSNRFSHVNYAPKTETWLSWAVQKQNINPDIVGFMKFKPEFLHKLDPDKEETLAWPSPRSWEMASSEEYAVRNYDWSNRISNNKIQEIYTDLVGSEAAVAFVGYLELKEFYNEKDVEAVYKEGAKAKRLPKRPDQAYAAMNSIASYKKNKKLTKEEVTNLLDFALSLPDLETRTPMLSMFKDYHPEVKTDEPFKTIWWEYIKKWHAELKGLE